MQINPAESQSRKPAVRPAERHRTMKRIFQRSIFAALLAVPILSASRDGNLGQMSLKNQQPTVIPSDIMTPRPATMALVAIGLLAMVGAGWVRRRRGRS
jgi:hypothetical protein